MTPATRWRGPAWAGVVLSAALAWSGGLCQAGPASPATGWMNAPLLGHTWVRVDDKAVEVLRFNPNGLLTASLGTQGGPVAGPLWHWQVQGHELVIAEQAGAPAWRRMVLQEVSAGQVRVKLNSGEMLTYQVEKTPSGNKGNQP